MKPDSCKGKRNATPPVDQPSSLNAEPAPHRSQARCYFELSKARLSMMVVITTVVGFLLALENAGKTFDGWRLLWVTFGTALLACGANSMNQWMEREQDARMRRTRQRPLPAGDLTPTHAFLWSTGVSLIGFLALTIFVNTLTAALGLFTHLLYVLVYTPMKSRSSANTLVGAIVGAVPPMMGWTAATGTLGLGACLLAATLFAWQIPHFLALAWLYRDDYERGGFRMLPVVDQSGQETCKWVVLYSLSLIPLGAAFTLLGMAGWAHMIGSVILGVGFLTLGVRLYRDRTRLNARRVFLASVIYLPFLLSLMVADRGSIYSSSDSVSSVSVSVQQPDGSSKEISTP